MDSTTHQQNILFVKTLLDEQPVAKRIEMYRWLANISGDPWITNQLKALADNLQQHTDISDQLDLKASGGNGQ